MRFFILKDFIFYSYMKNVNYKLVNENLKYGISKEVQWRKRLSKKYPSIIDNNKDNKFSSMDSYSNDNGICIEHEHKQRKKIRYKNTTTEGKWITGPMVNVCKIHKGIEQIKKGVRQIFYWTLEDDNNDMYFWELIDLEKQKDEIVFNRNGNYITGEGARDVVDIKWKYLTKWKD